MKLSDSNPEGEKSRQFNRGLRDLISAITRPATDKPGSVVPEEDEDGVRIITLAGTNTGATMRGELDDQKSGKESDILTTYVNSNFQAVNNSIMMESSHSTNDPGVHLDVSDRFDGSGESVKPSLKVPKMGKMKKDKGASKSDQNVSESID